MARGQNNKDFYIPAISDADLTKLILDLITENYLEYISDTSNPNIAVDEFIKSASDKSFYNYRENTKNNDELEIVESFPAIIGKYLENSSVIVDELKDLSKQDSDDLLDRYDKAFMYEKVKDVTFTPEQKGAILKLVVKYLSKCKMYCDTIEAPYDALMKSSDDEVEEVIYIASIIFVRTTSIVLGLISNKDSINTAAADSMKLLDSRGVVNHRAYVNAWQTEISCVIGLLMFVAAREAIPRDNKASITESMWLLHDSVDSIAQKFYKENGSFDVFKAIFTERFSTTEQAILGDIKGGVRTNIPIIDDYKDFTEKNKCDVFLRGEDFAGNYNTLKALTQQIIGDAAPQRDNRRDRRGSRSSSRGQRNESDDESDDDRRGRGRSQSRGRDGGRRSSRSSSRGSSRGGNGMQKILEQTMNSIESGNQNGRGRSRGRDEDRDDRRGGRGRSSSRNSRDNDRDDRRGGRGNRDSGRQRGRNGGGRRGGSVISASNKTIG